MLGLVTAVAVLVIVIGMIRARRLHERHALLWIAGALIIAVLGASPPALAATSRVFGIAYPPSMLFLVVVGFLALVVLDCVVIISKLTDRVRVLAQRAAIMEERLVELEAARVASAVRADGDPASPPREGGE